MCHHACRRRWGRGHNECVGQGGGCHQQQEEEAGPPSPIVPRCNGHSWDGRSRSIRTPKLPVAWRGVEWNGGMCECLSARSTRGRTRRRLDRMKCIEGTPCVVGAAMIAEACRGLVAGVLGAFYERAGQPCLDRNRSTWGPKVDFRFWSIGSRGCDPNRWVFP